ncbi:MAG TPA: hypothetical protein VIM44_05515 [Rariglobus sp.]
MASTVKIVLAVGGIFIAGAVTGGFVGWRVIERHAVQQRAQQQRLGPMDLGGRLAGQLHLTPEQKEQIRPLLTRTSEELRKIRRESFNATAGVITRMDADLEKILTEEQVVLLKKVRAEEEERRKRWMSERNKRNEQARPAGEPAEGAPQPPPADAPPLPPAKTP